jgi:hypothetical protein
MAIKIIKKRHAPEMREPAPLVEELSEPVEKPRSKEIKVASSLEELRAAPPGTVKVPEPTVCSFCGHAYVFPCHGKSDTCMNAKWVRERGGKS